LSGKEAGESVLHINEALLSVPLLTSDEGEFTEEEEKEPLATAKTMVGDFHSRVVQALLSEEADVAGETITVALVVGYSVLYW
jgi:hypothetical protein